MIAVVDDEPSVRTMLRRALRLEGFDVETFASGPELLASLARRAPDCTILDVHMPGMSGFMVFQHLRTARCRSPVIFITASDDVDLEAQAEAATLLRKPFSSETLFEAVRAALPAGPARD